MECWTWGDAVVYTLCTVLSMLLYLSPLGILVFMLKFPIFILFQFPYSILVEFKLTTFDRRLPNRTFSTFYEYSAMVFTRWVLDTFQSNIARNVFFGEQHARLLFFFRKLKYGTENIGDFVYKRTSVSYSCGGAHKEDVPRGFWVYSKSRTGFDSDLFIYFAPGNMAGAASPYFYLEYLSMLLVELQVQGFHNPVVFCIDVNPYEFRNSQYGFASYINTIADGWNYVLKSHPQARTMFMGSGVGGTALLSLLLHMARPCIRVPGNVEPSIVLGTPTDSSSNNSSLIEEKPDYKTESESNVTIPVPGSIDESFDSTRPLSGVSVPVDKEYSEFTGNATIEFITSEPTKPDAMLLISPLSRIEMDRRGKFPDIISNKSLSQLSRHLVKESESNCLWTNPSCVRDHEWWSEALPLKGSVIMYGGIETSSREIELLVKNLQSLDGQRVIDDFRDEEVHAWPITRSFLARTGSDQLDGISRVADHIAKMLVMDCLFAKNCTR